MMTRQVSKQQNRNEPTTALDEQPHRQLRLDRRVRGRPDVREETVLVLVRVRVRLGGAQTDGTELITASPNSISFDDLRCSRPTQ